VESGTSTQVPGFGLLDRQIVRYPRPSVLKSHFATTLMKRVQEANDLSPCRCNDNLGFLRNKPMIARIVVHPDRLFVPTANLKMSNVIVH
jgi:hypothetical protein